MEKVSTTPNAYITALPDGVRQDVAKLHKLISKVMRGEPRVLWSGTFWAGTEQNIIGYGALITERKGKRVEWFKIGLALQKNYISIYVNAVESGQYVPEIYGKTLGKVKVGKASVSFRSAADLDLAVVEHMLERARNLMGST